MQLDYTVYFIQVQKKCHAETIFQICYDFNIDFIAGFFCNENYQKLRVAW